MKKIRHWHLLIVGVLMIGACATVPRPNNPYFEMPPDHLLQAERELFSLALKQQKNNKLKSSIELWKRFLANNPRSFRGYNNLGMAHYTNDQLSPAISAFETGLALETFDHKIKDNLKRTLKFQVTLLRENKDYDAAIHFLKRIGELSKEPEKEKVALEIETMEDRIFEQVKRSNTLEDYENFLARYPNNPKNSDEARRQIALMQPQVTREMSTMTMTEDDSSSSPNMQLNPFVPEPTEDDSSSSPNMQLNPFVPEPMETLKSSIPEAAFSEDTIEIVAAEKQKSEEMLKADEFPEGDEPMLDPEPEVMVEPPDKEMKQKMSEEKPTMKKPPVKAIAMKPVKKVKVTTKKTPLKVRADPSSKAEVVAQLPATAIVPMFQETGQWYQIEYLPGKKGWISKIYSKRVN
jgi:tetratricopeptide (TPR) repeat protein